MKNTDNMDGHLLILFAVDHYTPLMVLRSLGEMGYRPVVVLVAEKSHLIKYSKYVGDYYQVKTIEEGFSLILDRFGQAKLKPFIFTGSDNIVECLDDHYDEISDKFIFFNSGGKGNVRKCQRKDIITSMAKKHGLNIPQSEVVETGVLPQTLKYPIITKVLASTMGAWKGDVYVCNNDKELKEAYKKIKSPKLILQEFIQRRGEFCMEGFSINHGEQIFMPLICNYLRLLDASYGLYMEFTPFNDNELRNKIEDLIKETKFEGIFEIEFMQGPNNEEYFLEINFRASPWVYALSYAGGNLPYFWAKSMLAGRIVYDDIKLDYTPFKAINDVDDFIQSVIYKKENIIQWLRELKASKVRYIYNSHDKSPFFHYLVYRFTRKFFQ